MKSKLRNLFAIVTLVLSGYANANSIINLNSTVYGSYTNSVDESSASASPLLVGRGSDYFITGNILFTDNSGVIRNVLRTQDDYFYWSWNSFQNSLIGTLAAASAMNRVELLNGGVLTSYMGDINAMNGNQGFCCSTAVQNLSVATARSANVPEPGTLLLTGLGLLGFVARKARRT
jgi:hypothetical protein